MEEVYEPLRGWIEIEVRDKDGKLIQSGRQRMQSFLNNLLRIIEGEAKAVGGAALSYYGLAQSATVILQDGTSGTAYIEWYNGTSYYGGGTPMALKASDDDDTYGIIVGSDTTPNTLNTYKIYSKISHGTSSGRLDYGPVSVDDLGLDTSVSPPVYRYRIVRAFSNLSGAVITIREVGLVARNYWKDLNAVRSNVKFLIARDVLSTSYNVPNGGSATVAITIEVVLG